MTNKTYVLDTSVLLSEGKRILSRFKNVDLVIPLVVIRELENKRTDKDLGRPARSVLGTLRQLQKESKKTLVDGISLPNNCSVRVELNHVQNDDVSDKMKSVNSNDVKILSVALNLKYELGTHVSLLTKDIPLSIYAEMFNLDSQDVDNEPNNREFLDSIPTFEIGSDEIDTLFADGRVHLDLDVPNNSGVVLKSGNKSALALSKPGYTFRLVKDEPFKGASAKSKEQHIAIRSLRDDTIKAVSLGGIAGGGKTMLALAGGVNAVENNQYKKIVVFRSMQAVGGEELGYLPGTEKEKLDPWTAAIYDALSSFLDKPIVDKLKREGKIEVLPITHVRGRTLANSWVIVDEAQNLSKDTILTLISRLSHSSKIILTHDVPQRDNFRVGRWDGIYDVVSRMHGNKLFSHVSMKKSERSELAQIATELLDDY